MTAEDVRVRLRTKLEAAFGAEEAALLMDRPPGGWNDLVTNQVLESRLAALEGKMMAELAKVTAAVERGFRAQTWRVVGAVFVAFGVFAGLVRGL